MIFRAWWDQLCLIKGFSSAVKEKQATHRYDLTTQTMAVLQVFGICWSYCCATWNSLTALYVGQTFSTNLFSLHTVGCSVNYQSDGEHCYREQSQSLTLRSEQHTMEQTLFFMPRRRTLVNTSLSINEALETFNSFIKCQMLHFYLDFI